MVSTGDVNIGRDVPRETGKGGTMNRSTIYMIVGGVVAASVVGGLFFYLFEPANRGVPPLPANARMFNNWAMVGCQPGAPRGRCVLLRRAVNQQTGRLIMQMTIVRAQTGAAVMAVTLPPNVIIPPGVTVTPTGGTAVKGTIRLCRPLACTAAVAVTDALAKEMAATEMTALEFVAANGRPIRMNVNTRGFAQGFAAWQAAVPAPAVAATPAPATGAAAPPAAAAPAQPAAKAAAPAQPAAKAAPAPAAAVK
jgi:invasion protein IalB